MPSNPSCQVISHRINTLGPLSAKLGESGVSLRVDSIIFTKSSHISGEATIPLML